LVNPCPLTRDVASDLARLGRVERVVASNCFHYAFLGAYAEAYPDATCLAPRSLFRKRPELRRVVQPLPDAPSGLLFPGVTYWRLPDFHADHAVWVAAAGLLYTADSLFATPPCRWCGLLPGAPDPGPSLCCAVTRLTIAASLQRVQPRAALMYAQYSRQYRPSGRTALDANAQVWTEILKRPITHVATGHGVHRAVTRVSRADLDRLARVISSPDTFADKAGRRVFQLVVLRCFRERFKDWSCLFDRARPAAATGALPAV